MNITPPSIAKLIEEFNKLPGIGSKTSERFVYHLLRQPKTELQLLIDQLKRVKDAVHFCMSCYTVTEEERCVICSDPQRAHDLLCVVAEPKDVVAIEKTGQFKGLYHVLGGVIDQTEGIGPEKLRIPELCKRIEQEKVKEVILATNPDMEGEMTNLYIAQQLKPLKVIITKMARGLPTGADIEFADEVTLRNAIVGRQRLE